MSITFAGTRKFSTRNVANHMFSNNMVASQSFKLRVDAATPPAIPLGLNAFRRNIFCFQHQFVNSPGPTVGFVIQLNGASGTVNHQFALTVGVVYIFCVVWDGTNHVQKVWVNGVPTVFGHLAGTTSTRIDPIEMGPDLANAALTYTLSDYNAWDSYALTQADAIALTNNGDPTAVGSGAPWRCRWTLDGPAGQAPAILDAGLRNAYGTGAVDGSDFAAVTGAGTAVYGDPLVWSPTVTPHAYVAGSGKNIGLTLTSNFDGGRVIPSQLLSVPTLTLNGVDQGPLTIPWGGHTTGVHECLLFSTPGTPPVQIGPGDVAELVAPPAWCNTPAGSVAALSGTIDNRAGGSSVRVEGLTKTLRLGVNNAPPGGLEYYPFKNFKYKTGLPGQIGKLAPNHGYEVTNQPCEFGEWLLVWDATKPSTPELLSLQSNAPSRVTVTHQPADDVSPGNGIGYVRTYNVQPVPSSDYETVVGGSGVGLNLDDPAPSGGPNYDNLWIYPPGEWSRDNTGTPVFDRSDQFALSNIYLDRITQEIGSMRAVDMTAAGGASQSYPYPELLLPRTAEWFWGFQTVSFPRVGFTSIGPVDVTATPWIYSARFRQPANLFSATLSQAITTTPAAGTHETYTFADAATAPLMAGLEIRVDSEIMRILGVSGTAVTLYRGSNGTTPAAHSAGTVTVFGRVPITAKVHADGTAPYTAPAFVQCNAPHGMTTAHGYYPQGTLAMTMVDGAGGPNFSEPNLGLSYCYVTGPTSFVSIWSGWYPSRPRGAKPSQAYTLDPATHYLQRLYVTGMPIDVYCELVARFPHANLHINVPLDACDDMAWTYARTCRDHFPAGRKIYVEHMNEPWNWAPPFRASSYCQQFGGELAMPASLRTYDLAYYAYDSARVHAIFRTVFAAAGRADEIVGILNCQMNSGSTQITPHLNLGIAVGQPFDAIAGAPYFSMGSSGNGLPATVAAFNLYDDDQAAEQLLHDITYDTTGIVSWMRNMNAAIAAYNHANGKACFLMGYEGGIEFAAPAGATNHDPRSHDIMYNPNFYHVEQGWYKILQDNGFDHLHIYALGIGYGPATWGIYHMRTQHHSLGDGQGGAFDNRAATITPGSPGYIGGSTLRQDRRVDSVRGQALIDWNAAISLTPATAYTLAAPTPDSGEVDAASGSFLVTPDGVYTGTVTVTPSGGGLSAPIVLTWAASSATLSFAITPTAAGVVILTPSNDGGLADASPVTYTATAPPPPPLVVFDGRDIVEAVQLWWATQADLQALTSDGKLWLIEAPETTALPYLTILPVGEPEGAARTTGYYFLAATFQISAHDRTSVQAVTLRNAVRDAIQAAPLAVGGKTVWYCLPGAQQLAIGEGRGPNGSDCWMATVDVDAPWQKGG